MLSGARKTQQSDDRKSFEKSELKIYKLRTKIYQWWIVGFSTGSDRIAHRDLGLVSSHASVGFYDADGPFGWLLELYPLVDTWEAMGININVVIIQCAMSLLNFTL
jgi:hypothetical protein